MSLEDSKMIENLRKSDSDQQEQDEAKSSDYVIDSPLLATPEPDLLSETESLTLGEDEGGGGDDDGQTTACAKNTIIKRVIFDDILVELGEFGLEQKINYVLFSLPYILTSMQLMGWVFVGFTPDHRCRVPGDPPDPPHEYLAAFNISTLKSYDDTSWRVDSCTRMDLDTNVTESCVDGYIYLEVKFIT